MHLSIVLCSESYYQAVFVSVHYLIKQTYMCNFQDNCCFVTIINENYKNLFKFLLLVQHMSFYKIFHHKWLRKNGDYK